MHSPATDASLTLQLIKISDLENDFINPHDATNSINAWVVRLCVHMQKHDALPCKLTESRDHNKFLCCCSTRSLGYRPC